MTITGVPSGTTGSQIVARLATKTAAVRTLRAMERGMLPLSRPRRRRWLLMGDAATGHQILPPPAPPDTEPGPSPEESMAVRRFADDCGLTDAIEIQIQRQDQDNWQFVRSRRPSVMVGRDPGCGVVLDHEDISRRHACIQLIDGVAVIADLGSRTGIRKRGKLTRVAVFEAGQRVELGPYTIRVKQVRSANDGAGSTPVVVSSPPALGLDFVNHRRRSQDCRLEKSLTLVGSGKACRLRLDHPTVSRAHCYFVRGRTHWWIVDLGSRPGTLVNGERISFAQVFVGAELKIGGFQVRIAELDAVTSAGDNSQRGGPPETVHRSGSERLTELTRRATAVVAADPAPPRPRRPAGVSDEVLVELFREFANLHERTMSHMQSVFQEMLQIVLGQPKAPVVPAGAGQPHPYSPACSAPLEFDSPNLAVVSLGSPPAFSHVDAADPHSLLTSRLQSLQNQLNGDRQSLAGRLLSKFNFSGGDESKASGGVCR